MKLISLCGVGEYNAAKTLIVVGKFVLCIGSIGALTDLFYVISCAVFSVVICGAVLFLVGVLTCIAWTRRIKRGHYDNELTPLLNDDN